MKLIFEDAKLDRKQQLDYVDRWLRDKYDWFN